MKKIKRVLFLFVAAFMLLVTLASCGSKKPSHIGSYGDGIIVITETEIKYYSEDKYVPRDEPQSKCQYRVIDSTIIMVYNFKSAVIETKTGKYTDIVRYTDEELDKLSPVYTYYLTNEGDLIELTICSGLVALSPAYAPNIRYSGITYRRDK